MSQQVNRGGRRSYAPFRLSIGSRNKLNKLEWPKGSRRHWPGVCVCVQLLQPINMDIMINASEIPPVAFSILDTLRYTHIWTWHFLIIGLWLGWTLFSLRFTFFSFGFHSKYIYVSFIPLTRAHSVSWVLSTSMQTFAGIGQWPMHSSSSQAPNKQNKRTKNRCSASLSTRTNNNTNNKMRCLRMGFQWPQWRC